MKKQFDKENQALNDLMGFSENNSIQKSYFPQLQKKLKELEVAKNYIDNVINSMPSILVSIDKTCKITHWNKEAERWKNINSSDAIGKDLFHTLPILIEYKEVIISSLLGKESINNLKLIEHQAGEDKIFEITIFPLGLDVDESVIRIDDISEKVNLEKMMIQSEKMLSLGGLAAGMAHEINNPIAGMVQNASVLKNRLTVEMPQNNKVADECGIDLNKLYDYLVKRDIIKIINLILNSGLQASKIINNMLNFARKADSEKKLYNIEEVINDTLEIAENSFNISKRVDFKKISIEKNYTLNQKNIICNKSQIQQVLLNLFKNSAEAMMEFERNIDNKIIINLFQENEFINIEIIDNGPGIPNEIIKKIFDPFFTTKSPGFGTGLGLSVSYFIIVENHGGLIEVDLIEPHGTKFSIKLPIE